LRQFSATQELEEGMTRVDPARIGIADINFTFKNSYQIFDQLEERGDSIKEHNYDGLIEANINLNNMLAVKSKDLVTPISAFITV